uniref:Uncharacterized protein n=1 Tax=Kalanchoe fedtschenkoi TaxID=63787 RepID=A0A7N0V1J7_KALFE
MMSSSSSSSSAAVRVDKATSDLLIQPDWTMNMEICDSLNSNHWQAKDVVKALKKRLQHKSSTVQLLALTLLETMVKNCGDYVHFQIVDRNILQEMVKIVRKKRSGVQFPKCSQDAAPICAPQVTHPPIRHNQPSYGMPSNASTRLDEAMASEMDSLSLTGLDAMGRVAELLTDMLRAVNPSDREAVKDELIVDLVDQCRSNQKRLMQMLTSTGDEEVLATGLELNDNLQSVLAKHDAIASGLPSPIHNQIADTSSQSTDAGTSSVGDQDKAPEVAPNSKSIVPVGPNASSQVEDVDDEEDDFAQLARRHSKHQNSEAGNMENLLSSTTVTSHESASPEADVSPHSNALVLADPPPPVRATKEQDMIDVLSLALTKSPHSPEPPAQSIHETPVSPTTQVHPNGFQLYSGQVAYGNYAAPWTPPQTETQSQLQTHPQQFHHRNNFHQRCGLSLSTRQPPFQPGQPHHLHQQQYARLQSSEEQLLQQQAPESRNALSQPQAMHPQTVPSQARPQLPSSQYPPQYSPGYIPPPWAATPGYYSNQRPMLHNNPPLNHGSSSFTPTQVPRSQQYNSGSSVNGDPRMSSSPATAAPVTGQKPFIPSYRLFEDLDVFRHTDGRVKVSSSSGSPSISGGPGQGIVGGNK